ncbi:MAG TPA: hypothetical protein VFP87_13820 [Chitinophagaceae bacterium]|nr:hypothetical protein [Chitinophagaceae bacterium]
MEERVFTRATEEREAWKKILGVLEQENIFQKNKLAEMLKAHEKDCNEKLLDILERYQSEFLQQDEAFKIMWNDLASLERSIEKGASKPALDVTRMNCSQDKLRGEIKNLQMHFNQLKTGFRAFFEEFTEVQL